jgi:hypothetical protein
VSALALLFMNPLRFLYLPCEPSAFSLFALYSLRSALLYFSSAFLCASRRGRGSCCMGRLEQGRPIWSRLWRPMPASECSPSPLPLWSATQECF